MFPLHFKQPTKTMQYDPEEFLNESGWASGQLVSYFGVFVGRILLEVVRLFSFWFRDNGIHGISIPKRTHILKTEFWWRRRPEN